VSTTPPGDEPRSTREGTAKPSPETFAAAYGDNNSFSVNRTEPAPDRVLVSDAAAAKAMELPDHERKMVASTLRHLGDLTRKSRPTRIPVPGARRDETVWALDTSDDKGSPVILWRRLGEDEGGGILGMAIVSRREWLGYLRAERSGELDTDEGRDLLLTQAFDV
jgi:hypothetical protein